MIIIYIQTMMLFPGVMLKKDIPSLGLTWKVVLLIGVFNIFDTVGKYMTTIRSVIGQTRVFWLVTARIVFYFTFIIQATTTDLPVIGTSWFAFLNVALFELTNGFTTSAVFVLGPEFMEGEKKEIIGFVLASCLSVGLMLGSFLSITLASLS